MDVAKKDASTNTESLNIKLYIDEEGRIKWRFGDVLETCEPKEIGKQSNSKQSNSNDIREFHEPHIIEKYFSIAFLIDCIKTYEFASHIVQNNNSNIILRVSNTHDHFDYMNFMKLYSNVGNRNNAWKEYNLHNDQYKLFNNMEKESRIFNKIINAINHAIGNSMKSCCIIIEDKLPLMHIITRAHDALVSDITFVAIGEYNKNDIANVSDIYAFMLMETAYEEFIDNLISSESTWKMAIINYIQQRYFTSALIPYEHVV